MSKSSPPRRGSPQKKSTYNSDKRYNNYIVCLLENLDSLRFQKQFVDTVIVFGNGTELPAHAVILAAGSNYFERALTELAKTELPYKVTLPLHISTKSFIVVLRFLYTARLIIPNDYNDLKELVGTAKDLELREFNEHLAECLATRLSKDNFWLVWTIAEDYDLHDLNKRILDFICSSPDTFLEHPEIATLSLQRFKSVLTYSGFSVNVNNKVLLAIISWLRSNTEQRNADVEELLKYVRFSTMSKPFLTQLLRDEPLINTSDTLRNYVQAALGRRTVMSSSTSTTFKNRPK